MTSEPGHTHRCLDLRGRAARPAGRHSPDREDTGTTGREMLYCLACRRPITSAEQRIAINGRHSHTFINPAGLTFRIGCFSSVPGCLFHGDATTLHSWFSGYSWRFAECAGCREHLGWHYVGAELPPEFSGLILDRLTTLPPTGSA